MDIKTSSLNPEVYTKIVLNDLVVFSVYYLLDEAERVVSEDIISACFTLFPKRFSLKKYPQWPDSAMVHRRWNDCRSRGYISVSAEHDFKLTSKGLRLAERVAKTLGLAKPPQNIVIQPPRPKKKIETIPPKKKKSISPAPRPKTGAQPPLPGMFAITQTKQTKPVVKAEAKPIKPAKKEQPASPVKSPAVKRVKQIAKPQAVQPPPKKMIRRSQKRSNDFSRSSARRLKSPPQVSQKRSDDFSRSSAKRLKPPLQVSKSVPAPKPILKTPPVQPVKKARIISSAKAKTPLTPVVQPVKQESISHEAKVRAAKFVRAMETSDAYRHYRKNGKNSTISEFDFRSLLLCTMESSSETLARNVELFKGYAQTLNRQDLVTFLVHCEEYFHSLLNPPVRKTGKIKQLLRKVA